MAEAGFNFVDDQCRSYFDNLFFLQRRRDEFKSGLAASAATTATILGVTNATVPTLTIVAAAFGLASSATDIVAGTYLYTQPPAITQGFVERLQLAYRAGAANNRALINTPTSAYYQIQRYLNLCLPPTIEAEITRQISSSSAVFVPSGAGAFFDVQSVGAPASALPRVGEAPGSFRGAGPGSVSPGATVAPSHVRKAREKVKFEPPPVFELPGARTQLEKEISAADLARFQRDLLCLPEKRTFDPLTREGITIYQQTRGATAQEATGQIDALWKEDMIRMDHGKPCPEGAKNFYELKSYFLGGKLQTVRVKELVVLLNKRTEGGPIDENRDLDDPATREKIAAVRQSMKDLRDPPSAQKQVTLPFINELRR